MEAVAGQDKNAYWEIVPGNNACFACRMIAGRRFEDKPGPVHPNCTCEIRQVVPATFSKYGTLEGYHDTATESFGAGQVIAVTIKNLGVFPAGVDIEIDKMEWRSTGHLAPFQSESFKFAKFGAEPVYWHLFLLCQGSDNSYIQYFIRG